jgi:predicted Zn-dependent peptidase
MTTVSTHRLATLAALALLSVAALPASAQDLASFEKNLTVHKLDNGMTFLIYERPVAPVFSFYTYVDVGSAQEVPGITGLAHFFEHMAFKGTTTIGTKDYKAEKAAMDAVDAAYAAYERERIKPEPNAERLAGLEQVFKDAQEKAGELVKKNEFGEIIDRNGGVGLNASTSADKTDYFYSLPANKVELWAYLESSRFLDPVFREFYKERDVVMEERRLRTESQPIGRLIEQMLAVSFVAHPYRQPTVGYMSDLKSITRADAWEFYKKHYTPANMTTAIVGDVKAEDVIPILDEYFGRIPAGPKPAPLRTVEPQPLVERVVRMPDKSQPVYVEGYFRPAATHPDDAIYNAIADVLSTGRTSRLYRSLVRDKQIAAFAGAFNGFPGTKYPHLMLVFGVTTPGNGNEDIQAAIREEIERIQNEPITDAELKRVKTRAKAGLIRGLANNSGLAIQLATYQATRGDWKELFTSVDKIEKVTKEDVQRIAKELFKPTNRTVAMIYNEDDES